MGGGVPGTPRYRRGRLRFPPVFRLIALIALGSVVFRYGLLDQLLVLAVLCAIAVRRGRESLDLIWRALRRIRWLLLSLAVIYLLVAPEPEVSAIAFLPGWSDIELALRRAGVLVLLVTAVELMRQTTPAPEIAGGIAVLLAPLSVLGLDTGRLSRRIALTLDAVPRTAELVTEAAGRAGIRGRDFGGWSSAAAELVREIEETAERSPAHADLPKQPTPDITDWLILGLVLVFLLGLLRL